VIAFVMVSAVWFAVFQLTVFPCPAICKSWGARAPAFYGVGVGTSALSHGTTSMTCRASRDVDVSCVLRRALRTTNKQ